MKFRPNKHRAASNLSKKVLKSSPEKEAGDEGSDTCFLNVNN